MPWLMEFAPAFLVANSVTPCGRLRCAGLLGLLHQYDLANPEDENTSDEHCGVCWVFLLDMGQMIEIRLIKGEDVDPICFMETRWPVLIQRVEFAIRMCRDIGF